MEEERERDREREHKSPSVSKSLMDDSKLENKLKSSMPALLSRQRCNTTLRTETHMKTKERDRERDMGGGGGCRRESVARKKDATQCKTEKEMGEATE